MRDAKTFLKISLLMLIFYFSSGLLLSGFTCQQHEDPVTVAKAFQLDPSQTLAVLKELTQEPHPFGSPRQLHVSNYINDKLMALSIPVYTQPFQSDTPNPLHLSRPGTPAPLTVPRRGVNLLAIAHDTPHPCIVLLASHYDSKIVGDPNRYVGANDSGSSTAGLMEALRFLKQRAPKTTCAIGGYFFDGEEPVLSEWNDGVSRHPAKIIDNRYGSRFAASALVPCPHSENLCLPQALTAKAVRSLILMDMIGSPDVKLTIDTHSSPHLNALAIQFDQTLSDGRLFKKSQSIPIDDDHKSFLEVGIPAIDLIDFHNLEHWHQHSDTLENLSLSSIEAVSRLALAMALSEAQ